MRIVYGVELILLVDAFLYLSGASGSGISCYRCWGDSCQDENFEPLTSATEEGCAQCYKVKSTYETYVSTLRGCSSSDIGTNQCTTMTSFGADVIACYCNGDLCNGASSPLIRGLSLYISLTFWHALLN
ncbi:hypothetical protein LSH36_274g06027 [Paralvinella palmiformis]|uniref:Protein sleepless n=1 Tax=Paralvinella palmiformis TaxID=53620 RepID=A0AAD9JJI0_9ANNE|nr:hypothetical protein LSH36_274g06027 [Paralvinella palmiformis]